MKFEDSMVPPGFFNAEAAKDHIWNISILDETGSELKHYHTDNTWEDILTFSRMCIGKIFGEEHTSARVWIFGKPENAPESVRGDFKKYGSVIEPQMYYLVE